MEDKEYVTKEEFLIYKKEIGEEVKGLRAQIMKTVEWQGKYGERIDKLPEIMSMLITPINDRLVGVENKFNELLAKPQRRWDMVVASAISAIVGGTLMAIVSRVFYMAQ